MTRITDLGRLEGLLLKLLARADGTWAWDVDDAETREALRQAHEAYIEAVPRYFQGFERLFSRAQEVSEFEFILALLRVRDEDGVGWDPYETTPDAFARIGAIVRTTDDFRTRRHLELWLYGHMLEATEPHGIIANMLAIAAGGRYEPQPFPPKRSKGGMAVDLTPGERIRRIVNLAGELGLPEAAVPLTESWDRLLRNAVFHSDYVLFQDEVRLTKPPRRYSNEQWLLLLNRAAAYHESLTRVHAAFVASYTEPRLIDAPSEHGPARAEVLVADGYGLIGLRQALDPSGTPAGVVPWSVIRPITFPTD